MGLWSLVYHSTSCILPLTLSLFLNNRKAKRAGLTAPKRVTELCRLGNRIGSYFHYILKSWNDLNIGGMILLSAAFALILLPIIIASKAANGWASPHIIAMLVVGISSLIIFPIWGSTKKLAPYPLIPLVLLKSRTFCAACGIGFFYFSKLLPTLHINTH